MIPMLHVLSPELAIAWWPDVEPWLEPTLVPTELSKEALLIKLGEGIMRLVLIRHGEVLVGAALVCPAMAQIQPVLHVYALAGKDGKKWYWGLDQLLNDLGKQMGATFIEFLTRRNSHRLATKFGFEAVGMLYRKGVK